MKHLTTILLALGIITIAYAQSPQQADKYFQDKNYQQAEILYQRLVARYPKTPLYCYRYARCLYERQDYEKAIEYFKSTTAKYGLANFYIGESAFQTYMFDNAVKYFDTYLASIDTTHANWKAVQKRRSQCIVGQRLIKHVQDIVITDTFIMPKQTFLSAYHLTKEAGTISANKEMHITFTNSRNNRQIITRYDDNDSITSLYSTEKLIDGWADTIPFYQDPQHSINFPFLLNDGVTLYFATERSDGMGGLDIYRTRYDSDAENFLRSENIGFPFNSPYNDYMLAVDENEGIGYFATDRDCEVDSVTIIQFVWDEKKDYLLTSPDDTTTRQIAQLKVIKIDSVAHGNAKIALSTDFLSNFTSSDYSHISLQTPPDFQFVVADGVEYTQYSDFTNAEALEMFRTYEQALIIHQKDNEKLDNLRMQYINASSEQRSRLSTTIQNLEETTAKQQLILKQKEKQIRKLENSK